MDDSMSGLTVAADGPLRGPPLNRSIIPNEMKANREC